MSPQVSVDPLPCLNSRAMQTAAKAMPKLSYYGASAYDAAANGRKTVVIRTARGGGPCRPRLVTVRCSADCPSRNRAGREPCNTDRPLERSADLVARHTRG